jgi:hypothetical protein
LVCKIEKFLVKESEKFLVKEIEKFEKKHENLASNVISYEPITMGYSGSYTL